MLLELLFRDLGNILDGKNGNFYQKKPEELMLLSKYKGFLDNIKRKSI